MTTTNVPDATVCYRHPERAAGVSCQRCGQSICAECFVDAPVGFLCPECAAAAEARIHYVPAVPVAGRPYVALALIAVNVLVAAASLLLGSGWLNGDLDTIGLRGALIGGARLLDGASFELVGVAHGEWYRVFTGAFLHGGPVHLAFNMLALWQAGILLEGRLGRVRFATVYAVAILGGAFGALLLSPDNFTVGASGGVFGLFGALFVAERKGLFGRVGSSFGMLIVFNLVLTFAIPGISIGGHIGGLAAGSLLAWTMLEYEQRSLPNTIPLALAAGLALVLFVGCLWAATLSGDPLYVR